MRMNFEAPAWLIFWPDCDGAVRGEEFPALNRALVAAQQDHIPRVHWIVTGSGDVLRPWHIASLLARHQTRL
jgi:hypothetical protein